MRLPFGFRIVRDKPTLHPVSLARLNLKPEDVRLLTEEVHRELLRQQKRNGGLGIT